MLTHALGEQLAVVRAGIELHAVKCSKDMMPLHQHLSSRFVGMAGLLRGLGVTERQPGPVPPGHGRYA